MFNIDQLCPSLWDVCQAPHASYYRIRYILSNWGKIFQSLLFPGIQLTRVALIYPAQGQITIANNKTYKKATSRAWIFVCSRGMNILNIFYLRSQELECGLPALQCHRIASILLTTTLKFLFCLTACLSCAVLIRATLAWPLNYIPVPFLEGWGHAGVRYLITVCSVALVLLSRASSNINAIWDTFSHPGLSMLASSPSSEPLTRTNLIWTGLLILDEEIWQGY